MNLGWNRLKIFAPFDKPGLVGKVVKLYDLQLPVIKDPSSPKTTIMHCIYHFNFALKNCELVSWAEPVIETCIFSAFYFHLASNNPRQDKSNIIDSSSQIQRQSGPSNWQSILSWPTTAKQI